MNRLPRSADFISYVIDDLDKDDNGKIINFPQHLIDVVNEADSWNFTPEGNRYPDDPDLRICFWDGSTLIVYNPMQLHAPARVQAV